MPPIFIPIPIGVVLAVVSALGVSITVAWKIIKVAKSKLLVLGAQASGKTTFLRHYIPDIPDGPTKGTFEERVIPFSWSELFKWNLTMGDISGKEDFVAQATSKLRSDEKMKYIVLFIDLKKYFEDESTQKHSNNLMYFVVNNEYAPAIIPRSNGTMESKKVHRHYCLVLTHLDQCNNGERERFEKEISNKPYHKILNKAVFGDIRDKEVANKVFKKLD